MTKEEEEGDDIGDHSEPLLGERTDGLLYPFSMPEAHGF